MYYLFIILSLLISIITNAQKKLASRRLVYFIDSNSLVGVKDQRGKIIIPSIHINFPDYKNGELVKGSLIYLDRRKVDSTSEPHSWGVVYNRKGKFLYAPFAFDNGPDYLSEGIMRYVKKGKVGFVNRQGEIVIPAQFDFVESFNYGIASYCIGCMWDHKGEHQFVKGGSWGYINFKGQKISAVKQKAAANDQTVDSGFLLCPYTYSSSEKKLINFFNQLEIINKAHFANYHSSLDSSEKKLHYEIVEWPTIFFPYYHIKAFEFTNDGVYYQNELLDNDLNFFVTKNRKHIFLFEGEKKIAFSKWLKKYVVNAKKYILTHPEAHTNSNF